MSNNFESIKIPKIPNTFTHILKDSSPFWDESNGNKPPSSTANVNFNSVPAGTEIIALEDSVGYKQKWLYVLVKDINGNFNKKGYVYQELVVAANNQIKPFIKPRTLEKYQPLQYAPEINWRNQKSDIMFFDRKNGLYCVSVDTGIQVIIDENQINKILEESLYKGLSIIFKSIGKVSTTDYIRSLQNKYHFFGRVSSINFDLKNCSTLKVFVSIPMRHAESLEILKSGDYFNPNLKNIIQQPSEETIFAGDPGFPFDDTPPFEPFDTPPPQPPQLLDLVFENYNEYNSFFAKLVNFEQAMSAITAAASVGAAGAIAGTLGSIAAVGTGILATTAVASSESNMGVLNACDTIYSARQWEITPDTFLDFKQIMNYIRLFKEKTDNLIFSNIPVTQITDSIREKKSSTINSSIIGVGLAIKDIFTDVQYYRKGFDAINPYIENAKKKKLDIVSVLSRYDIYSAAEAIETMRGDYNGIIWDGKLTITVNLDSIVVEKLKFVNSAGVIVEIVRDVETYLQEECLLDVTSINYIIKCYEESKKENSSFFEINNPSLTNPLLTSIVPFKKQDPVKKSPDQILSDFVLAYHYPKITEMQALPLDITQCTKETNDLIKDIYKGKTRQAKQFWTNIMNNDIKSQKKYEGGFLQRFISGIKNDYNLKILFGEDPETEELMKTNPLEAVRTKYYPALQEMNINGILAELLKCNLGELSPEELAELLGKYNVAKDYLEQLAFSTICNPFLVSTLKTINSIELPTLEILNSDSNLMEQLEKYFITSFKEIALAAVRELIKSLMKGCLEDQNPENQPEGASGLADDIADALENPEDEAEIDDLIGDIFGDEEEPAEEGTPSQFDYPKGKNASKPNRRDKAKDLLDSFSCLLTTNEICRLLNGSLVSDEIYNTLVEVVKRKYPKIWKRNKLKSQNDIKNFFSTIGRNIDLSVCNVVLTRPDIIDCGCSDDVRDGAKKAILLGKGLPDNIVDDIIKDIKDTEKKNIDKVLDFLDRSIPKGIPGEKDPIDYSDFPSVLCKRSPSGDLIPPTVMLSPSLQSFKGLVDNTFRSVYDTFDLEAEQWSKTAYSISSSQSPMISFDETTGKLVPKKPPELNEDAELDEDNPPDLGVPANGSIVKQILPSYLFTDIIQNKKYEIDIKNNEFIFSTFINGNEQQKLDADLITEPLKEKVKAANENLKFFISTLFRQVTAAIAILSTQTAASAVVGAVSDSASIFDAFWGDLTTFQSFMGILDSFLRDTSASLETDEYQELMDSIGGASEEMNLFLGQTGATNYLKIMTFLRENKADLYTLADKISSVIDASSTENIVDNRQQLIDTYENSIKVFEDVERIYKVVFSSTVNYPEYNFTFFENVDPKYNKVSVNNGQLFDRYKVEIQKNNSKFITFEDITTYSEDIRDYIFNDLEIEETNPDKSILFQKYLSKIQIIPPDSYKQVSKFFIDRTFDCIKNESAEIPLNNPFLGKIITSLKAVTKRKKINIVDEEPVVQKVTEVIPETWKSLADYLTLVLPDRPTPQEKACGIRPHYLDIDDLKNDAVNQKGSSMCIEEVVSDKIRNNESIDSEDLKSIETNDTQKILLLMAHTLTLRVYLHDLILRSIGLFGYFDPQILREDDLFINYLTNCVESEIRGIDNVYYELLTNFIIQNIVKTVPPIEGEPTKKDKKNAIKELIKEQLKIAVLPKLAKRIVDDTYEFYNKQKQVINIPGGTLQLPDISFDLRKYNNLRDLISCLKLENYVEERTDGIYFSIDGNSGSTFKVKLFNGKIDDYDDSSVEFKLLFEYIFPIKRYISCAFITNNLCTTTRKQILNTFIGTKSALRKLTKEIQANGQPLVVNPNNPQDLALDTEPDGNFLAFILKALVTTPIQIAKGFLEVAEPTVAISANLYKIGKALDPELPASVNPSIGLPIATAATIAMFWLPNFAPFAFNIYNGIYYGLALWDDGIVPDIQSLAEEKKNNLANDLLSAQGLGVCEELADHKDKLKFDDNKQYVIFNRYEQQSGE